jgi:hypothetical protein
MEVKAIIGIVVVAAIIAAIVILQIKNRKKSDH